MHNNCLEPRDVRDLRLYRRRTESPLGLPGVLIDHGLPMPGEPALLKRRWRVPRDAELIEWKGLQLLAGRAKKDWGRAGRCWMGGVAMGVAGMEAFRLLLLDKKPIKSKMPKLINPRMAQRIRSAPYAYILAVISFSSIIQPEAKAMCGEGKGLGWIINTSTGQSTRKALGRAMQCSATDVYGSFANSVFSASYIRSSSQAKDINAHGKQGNYEVTINGATMPGRVSRRLERLGTFCVQQQGDSFKYCWQDGL